jgi:hypothetical protein
MIVFNEEISFFENLQIADSERIHSEFISWILSPSCKSISETEKYSFIDNLFGLVGTNQIIKSGTEIDNIDILIETNNFVLVIENKIKSSQHSNQLSRYKEFVEIKYSGKQHRFIFLTLVKEQKIDNNWTHVSYYDIFQELNMLNLLSNKHSTFVEDYLLYLTRLLSALNDVVANPIKYAYVFENGSMKKSNKLHLKFENKIEEFIAKNQLETIFQKAFLTKLLDDERIRKFNGTLTDTRGTALIDFPLKINISIGEKRLYTTFIQIQGDNIKFAFAIQENYLDSKRAWIQPITNIFKVFKKQNISGFNKFNPPKSLAYVSISKKMKKAYWKMNFDEIISMIIDETRIGHELSEILMKEIKNIVNDTESM